MRRIRSQETTPADRAGSRPEGLAPPPSAIEEANRILERLTDLVESRRRETPPAPSVPAPASAPSPPPAPGVAVAATEHHVVGARHSGRLLGNLLVARGFLVDTELQHALARQARTGAAIGRVVVELGYISERDLVEVLAEQLRMPVVDPTRRQTDPDVVARLPADAARRLGAVALRRVDDRIEVAIADPTDAAGVAELTRLLGGPLRLSLATRGDVDAAIERLYP